MKLAVRLAVKRSIDIGVSALGLAFLGPLLIAVYAAVRCTMGAPALFRQQRPGRQAKPFTLYKFRTMGPEAAPDGRKLPDSDRITPLGRILRRTSLDELPQLWNVLKGDMSLIGPRPLYMHYLPWYTERERLRHSFRPGITGLAQVSGRNTLGWDEKLDYDVQYVEGWSLRLDLMIAILTLLRGFSSRTILDAAPQGALDVYRRKQGKEVC